MLQYKKIVSWLEYESSFCSDEDAQKAQALRLASHLNLAMCHLKLQAFSAAIESCNKVGPAPPEEAGLGVSCQPV